MKIKESLKAVFGAILILTGFPSLIMLIIIVFNHFYCTYTVKTTFIQWIILAILFVLALGSWGCLILINRYHPKELAPDYLFQMSGGQPYFDRHDFAFIGQVRIIDGVAYMECVFQNQRDVPSQAKVVFRAGQRFLWGRHRLKSFCYEIECASGAFGMARSVFPIHQAYQGKTVRFEVGATIHYPLGKGKLLRFREGIYVRTNYRSLDAFGAITTVLGVLGGSVVISKPAFFTVTLPTGVLDELPVESPLEVETWWKLGDPPLESAGAAANPATT